MSGTHAQAKPFAAGALAVGVGVLAGYTLRETAGAVATVRLWDNASAASGTILATVALAANASAVSIADSGGIWFNAGVFAQVVAGTVEGSVFLG